MDLFGEVVVIVPIFGVNVSHDVTVCYITRFQLSLLVNCHRTVLYLSKIA